MVKLIKFLIIDILPCLNLHVKHNLNNVRKRYINKFEEDIYQKIRKVLL